MRILLFILVSGFFMVISRRPLKNPRSHGFYRFFGFEGILILFLLNVPYWFHERFSAPQLISWAMLFSSLYCLSRGVSLLKRRGGRDKREASPENFAFENTAHLVIEGIYRHIRHPMYTSLLLLAWGLFLKHVSLPAVVVTAATTIVLLQAARIEEQENIAHFGNRYRDYMRQTKRFIPFVY
jgi:protein-S-isoprenylcysteine O-methyltransferase Ste14